MGAGLKICRKRTACAVLASGVVISLTAMTGGVAPAFAKPGDEPVVPATTVIAPAPVAPAQQQQPAAPAAPAAPAPPAAPTAAAPVAPAPVEATAPVEAPPVVEAPPKTRSPQLAPSAEAPAQTRAPEPAPSATNPPTSREAPTPPSTRATVTETTQSPSSQAPSSQAPSSQAPSTQAPSTQAPSTTSAPAPTPAGVAPTPSDASAVPSPGLVAPTPGSGEPTPSGATPSPSADDPRSSATEPSPRSPSESGTPSSGSPNSTASSAASSTAAAQRVIEKVAPETLAAPDADVQIAKSAKVVEEKPDVAPKKDIEDVANVINLQNLDRPGPNGLRDDDRVRLAGDRDWDRNVRQWRPDWVNYDEYYRPVLSNPYRDPVRIVYIYQNAPRVVWIPPLARIVLEVAQYAAYSFTAVVTNTINQAVNVAVGSFFGGGYFPGIGLPLPPPPPPLLNFANVPVQVRYPNANYEPFRVNKIVDVGDDAQYGERKVLLDGVTPAWGQWTQTPSGERSFEVHKTQQFPGLDDPRPGPLPGDYQLRLASDESPSGMTNRDVYLVAVAIACGVLSIGAVGLAVFMGRRRRPLH